MKKIILKRILVFLVAVFAAIQNYAQDIVYTVTGIHNEKKIALDSILVENLTNGTHILFGPLPGRNEYLINLTQKVLTSINGIAIEGPAFTLAQNSHGILKLKYNEKIPTAVKVAVFNVNGQLLYSSEQKNIYPGNTVSVFLGASGIYLVKLESSRKVEIFKAMGSGRRQNYHVNIENDLKNSINIIKSTDPSVNFEFNRGDSLRITAYKKDLFAWPEGMRIEGSAPVDFRFKQSTIHTTGISDAYIPLDENGTKISNYDATTGELEIEFTGVQPEMRPGGILTFSTDSSGHLRQIVSITEEAGTIRLQTRPAYFKDLFINKEFKIHTGFMSPNTPLKSTSGLEEISRALTDENGYIHPAEIIYVRQDNKKVLKSALENARINDDRISIIDEEISLKYTLFDKEIDGTSIKFYSDESSKFTLNVDFVAEFECREGLDKNDIDEDFNLQEGDIVKYTYYLDGKADLNVKLKLDVEGGIDPIKPDKPVTLELPAEILDGFSEIHLKFIIGVVPLWITINNEILYNYELNADAKFNAEWGFTYSHFLKVGATYNDGTSDGDEKFEPFCIPGQTFLMDPLKMTGEVEAKAHFEVYPRVEILFYDFMGPYFELVPYINGSFRMKGNLTTYNFSDFTDDGKFVAWDNRFGVGLDARLGSKIDFLWGLFDKEWNMEPPYHFFDYDENYDDYAKTILSAPHQILMNSSQLPDYMTVDDAIPLTFYVTGFSLFPALDGKPTPYCPVIFESRDESGTLTFRKIIFTNAEGVANLEWKENSPGVRNFSAKIYYADDFYQNSATLLDAVYGNIEVMSDFSGNSGTFKDLRDSRIYKWKRIGNQVWMAENLKYIPRGETFYPVDQPDIELIETGEDYDETKSKPYYYIYGSEGGSVFDDNINHTIATRDIYGVLYSYGAAMNRSYSSSANPSGVQGICPAGWHLPSDAEWEQLAGYVADSYGGNVLDGDTGWEFVGKYLKGTNYTGFDAQYGGLRDRVEGVFRGIDYSGYWWSATKWVSDCSYCRYIYVGSDNFYKSHLFNQYGLSVRCVKD